MNTLSVFMIGVGLGIGAVPFIRLIQAWRDYSQTLREYPLRHPNPKENKKLDVKLLLKNGTLH